MIPELAGGLAEEVDEKTLRAAFVPFGEVTDVQIPLDPNSKGALGIVQIFQFLLLVDSKYLFST